MGITAHDLFQALLFGYYDEYKSLFYSLTYADRAAQRSLRLFSDIVKHGGRVVDINGPVEAKLFLNSEGSISYCKIFDI